MDVVYRDSLSAWRALRDAGGLDIDDRDRDLVSKLKAALDPASADIEGALAQTSVNEFLRALFQTIEPFVGMFRDILAFFEQAGAHQGQSQWRLKIDDQLLELRHFEEFLERWNSIDGDIEVPALDRHNAFILNTVRNDVGGSAYLREGMAWDKPSETGIADVDAWLLEYYHGRYAPFPQSLYPDRFLGGLSDAAAIVLAAVTILRERRLTRDHMLDEHRKRHFHSVEEDALHPWTIAQSETDFWLLSHVVYLANILRLPAVEQELLAAKLTEMLAPFPRRRIAVSLDVQDLERLLSLPVWKKRYETYGVWVATRIVAALEGHDVTINAPKGELKFSFGGSKIADIETARPRLSLFSERRVPLADPIGKSRKEGAQPDFSLWTQSSIFPDCPLVVEVKHYKKRSRSNFRAALIDYARAHSKAEVILVNYGPVGADFDDLPSLIGKRCKLLGDLTPMNRQALEDFRAVVRHCVGDPAPVEQDATPGATDEVFAIDVSASMGDAVESEGFTSFLAAMPSATSPLALIDESIRAFVPAEAFAEWLAANELGSTTSLAGPVEELLGRFRGIILLTDRGGIDGLTAYKVSRLDAGLEGLGEVILARVTR